MQAVDVAGMYVLVIRQTKYERISNTQYIVRAKEPSIPLPDAFDGNPKNLKKFLTELDLCFRAAPTKFAGDDAKIITAGRLCSGTKVYPWWNTWLLCWKEKQVEYQTWRDF